MWAWILWSAGVLAFGALAAAMGKHQREVFVQPVSQRMTKCYQAFGCSVLGITLLFSIWHWGASVGVSQWVGLLTFSALVVIAVVSYLPKFLPKINMVFAGLLLLLGLIKLLA